MLDSYDMNLIVKCQFLFNSNKNKYFKNKLSLGTRMSCWLGKNITRNTASSVIEVADEQNGEFEAVFVLLNPNNFGDNFGLDSVLSFGSPGISVGEGKVVEIMGYWEGKVP